MDPPGNPSPVNGKKCGSPNLLHGSPLDPQRIPLGSLTDPPPKTPYECCIDTPFRLQDLPVPHRLSDRPTVKDVAQDINDNLDVDGLCREFPYRPSDRPTIRSDRLSDDCSVVALTCVALKAFSRVGQQGGSTVGRSVRRTVARTRGRIFQLEQMFTVNLSQSDSDWLRLR